MNNRAVPDNIARLAAKALKPIHSQNIEKVVETLYGLSEELVEIIKLILRNGVRTPASIDSYLKCVNSGAEFEANFAYATGQTSAESEVFPSENEQDTVTLVALLTLLLDWITHNRVTMLMSADTDLGSKTKALSELHAQWVTPVTEVFIASCMGTSTPMPAIRTKQTVRARARAHFDLIRRAPEKSQAFMKSLSPEQIKHIEVGLTPQERLEFTNILESSRKGLGVYGNAGANAVPDLGHTHDTNHAALLLEPVFDTTMLIDSNKDQVMLLGSNAVWGPVFRAAVESTHSEKPAPAALAPPPPPCDALWQVFEKNGGVGNDIQNAIQIESLNSNQLMNMLVCSTEVRIHKLNRWMGLSTPGLPVRPGVQNLIANFKKQLESDGTKTLEANPLGYAFAIGLFNQFQQDAYDEHSEDPEHSATPSRNFGNMKIPFLVFDEKKKILEHLRAKKGVEATLSVWLGPAFSVTDFQKVLHVLREIPLFMHQ